MADSNLEKRPLSGSCNMSSRPGPHLKMPVGIGTRMRRAVGKRWLSAPRLIFVVLFAFGISFALTACENVATYTQPSLVRVIDASYIAPAVNVQVEGTLL